MDGIAAQATAALKRERLSRRQQAFRADFRARIGRLEIDQLVIHDLDSPR